MGKIRCNLTVYFEEPFWVGVFEVIENHKISRRTPRGFNAKRESRLRQPVSVPSRSRQSNCNRSRTNRNVGSEAVNRNWLKRNASLN